MPTLDLRYQAVRHLDDTAIPFVINSWLKSYRWSDKDNPDYYRNLVPRIKQLIKTNRVMVATLAEEPDCFVGWICGAKGQLHYAYVKSVFRRDGVAKELIDKVCGKYGTYTFKSRNNAFLRHLDERGFEYVEEAKRDQCHLAKESGARVRCNDGDKEPVGIEPELPTDSGPRRGDSDVTEISG